MISCLKEQEEENRRLNKIYAEERLKAEIIQEAIAKKVVKPSQRKEMAIEAVNQRQVGIRFDCTLFLTSGTC